MRSKNYVKSYINGYEYYHDVYNAIEMAMSEICITDWMFSPELYLKRPCEEFPESRLDKTLIRAAKRGVKIYILIYKEFSAMSNSSVHVRDVFLKDYKNPNIEFIRHPHKDIFLWSHHEKLCIVDQMQAFMGGLDLCFGRYEEPGYKLSEPFMDKNGDTHGQTIWPGGDYNNMRHFDFGVGTKYNECMVDKVETPRCPWRDIAIQICGSAVKDLVRHFVQYWNFAKNDIRKNKEVGESTNIGVTKDAGDFTRWTLMHDNNALDLDNILREDQPEKLAIPFTATLEDLDSDERTPRYRTTISGDKVRDTEYNVDGGAKRPLRNQPSGSVYGLPLKDRSFGDLDKMSGDKGLWNKGISSRSIQEKNYSHGTLPDIEAADSEEDNSGGSCDDPLDLVI